MRSSDVQQRPNIRAGCYCRISSDPNDKRQGVERQREDTAVLCEVEGWQVAGVYVDNDRSASTGKERPEWERLLADVNAGTIDAIVVWNQDRGWRKMSDLESLRPVLEPRGVLLATTNIGIIDFRNADDVFRAQVSTALSEMEVAKMRVRQKRAGRQRAEQGRPKWRQAFGYQPYTGRKEDDDGTRHLDPVVAPLVAEAYRAIVAGASLKDVATHWNDAQAYGRAGKPWNESLVSHFLRKPRNAGLREYGGEIIGKGTWTPLVDEPLWRAAQETMNKRAGSILGQRRSARRHLLTGMMFCGKDGCGDHLVGKWVMQKTGGKPGRPKAGQTKEPHPGSMTHRVTYSCRKCRGVSVRADDVEPLLYDLIGGRLAMPDAVDLLKTETHDAAEAEAIRTEKASLYSRLDELAVERAQGLMTGRQLQIASEGIQQQIDALERKEQDQERLRVFDGIPLGTPQAVAAVKALSPDRFRAVLSVLCKVTVMPVGKGSRTWNPERVKVTPL